ncbi:histone acetyltransferase type B catalytic subunit [Nilaparvata lugens]|uniref:histone acetyltransferase type B catalytic subunit n=1 Tax=Nilaparvata lugens TaxID=108931 RepID=UPI00193D7A96|nr:histone acetyltransferase type B catalytic subunit [Nilaparvata lugens]
MSHQVFSQSENIFGYKDLKVKLYYTAAWLTTYVGIEYSEQIDPEDFDGVEADNIMEKLSKILQPGFLTNIDTFVASLDKEPSFEPYGELKHSFKVTNRETNKERTYEIYYCSTLMTKFINYHERLQTFLLWYIDGASFIDVDDSKWQFFVVYEKYMNSGQPMYSVAGYTTVYEYYAYPTHVRPRISQVLVLPPHQKQGICTHLINTIYDHYKGDATVLDITVEDPTEEFQTVRDFVDACRCAALPAFRPDCLQQGFSELMAQQARESSRINKKQARRVYEILRLKETNMNDKMDYQNYRINVKRRLNIPFQKEQAYFNKMSKALKPEELQSAVSLNSIGQRTEKLEKLYKELEEQYLLVLKRIKREAVL